MSDSKNNDNSIKVIRIVGDRPYGEAERSAINASSVRFKHDCSRPLNEEITPSITMEQEITDRIKRLALPKLPVIANPPEMRLVRGRKLWELEGVCKNIQQNLNMIRQTKNDKQETLMREREMSQLKNQQLAEIVRQSKMDGKHLIWWKRKTRLMDIDKRLMIEQDVASDLVGGSTEPPVDMRIRRAPPAKQIQLQRAQMQCLSRALRLMDDREKQSILQDRIRDYESSRCPSGRSQSST